MAHRLTSHHRALFSPKYLSGTSAHITTTSFFRTPFDVKNSEDFQKRVLASTKPVLVDFHAEWCHPCKLLATKLDDIVGQKNGLLELAKVDIDNNADLALDYEVTAVPTVLGVKNGKIIDSFKGAVDTEQLKQFVDKLLQ